MSEENVEVVRSMYEAFNEGDAARALTYLHPEAELHQPRSLRTAGSTTDLLSSSGGRTCGWKSGTRSATRSRTSPMSGTES
jgi:hypothetical protein